MPAKPALYPTPRSGKAAAHPPSPGSEAAPLTAWQERVFRVRQHKMNRFATLMAGGMSRAAAAAESGYGIVHVWRLEKRMEQEGVNGLVPKIGKGCPPLIDPALFTPAVVSALQRLAVRLGGVRAAARSFSTSPQCPRALARYIINRDAVPDRLRALVGFRRARRAVRFAGEFVHIEGAGQNQHAA